MYSNHWFIQRLILLEYPAYFLFITSVNEVIKFSNLLLDLQAMAMTYISKSND